MAAGDDGFLDEPPPPRRGDGARCTRCFGSDPSDPNFAPEEPSTESLGLLTATIDDEIESIFLELPDDNEELAPIRGRGEEVRERLRLLDARRHDRPRDPPPRRLPSRSDALDGRRLGAARLRGRARAVAAGAPPQAQPAARRRRHAALVRVRRLRHLAPARRRAAARLGSACACEFLAGYRATVDQTLMPSGSAMDKLLAVFELEKAVYELRYELNHRPDWVAIPVAGIAADARRGGAAVTQAPRSRRSASSTSGSRAPAGTRSCTRSSARIPSREASGSRCGRRTRRGVSVVGDFNDWDAGADPLEPRRRRRASGKGSSTGRPSGQRYKFHLDGATVEKADPLAFEAEVPPKTASVVFESEHEWDDDDWLEARRARRAARPARSRSTRCTRRRGGRASAGASSREQLVAVRAATSASRTSSCCR